MELFGFRHQQWLLVAVTTLVVVPLMMIGVFYGQFRTTVLRKFFVPGVEARYGYKMEPRRLYYGKQPLDVYVISSIQPNGRMAAAGGQVGDVPVGLFHINDVALAEKLSAPDASQILLNVIEIGFYEEFLRNDLSGPIWEKRRELIVASDK